MDSTTLDKIFKASFDVSHPPSRSGFSQRKFCLVRIAVLAVVVLQTYPPLLFFEFLRATIANVGGAAKASVDGPTHCHLSFLLQKQSLAGLRMQAEAWRGLYGYYTTGSQPPSTFAFLLAKEDGAVSSSCSFLISSLFSSSVSRSS